MTLSFIHTADWHVGRRFSERSEAVRSVLQRARIEQVSIIAAAARARGIKFVLVAGDVFDSVTTAEADVRATLAKLRAASEIKWVLLPGNHDAAIAGGLWDRMAAYGLPDNVRVILTPEPFALSPDVVVLPAPLMARQISHDPTAIFDVCPTPQGMMRIGLAHGAVARFGRGDRPSASEIAPDRAARAGLDYLALGDWHGTQEVADRTWYSGTPETDRAVDNASGHILAVKLEGARAMPRIERIATTQFSWQKLDIGVSGLRDLDPIRQLSRDLGARASKHIVDLTISGQLARRDAGQLDDLLTVARAELLDLTWDLEHLAIVQAQGDAASVAGPEVRALIEALEGLEQGASDAEARAHASRAIEQVFSFAAAVAVPQPTGQQRRGRGRS